MKQLILYDIKVNYKEKRDSYKDVVDFINSDICYDGTVCVLYGLRRTGKTTIMHQVMTDNADKFSSLFLEVTQSDTMEDVYSCLDNALKNGIRCVFIDEITNIPDFIEESALLADIYAKEGLRIVLAGTDSLSFVFAENNSLYDRTVHINTAYISFEEHCRVLGTNDLDDYICYGGFMRKGASAEDRIVYDYTTACRYLDDAVSGNISRSLRNLAKYSDCTELFDVSENEMKAVLKKMAEKYSGVLNETIVNEELAKTELSFPIKQDEFKEIEEMEIFRYLRANNPEIVKELAKEINSDTKIVHKFTEDMIARLENDLINLGFVSAVKKQEFCYSKNYGWRSLPVEREYYLIQPAIKYYHLKKALEFIETNEHYNSLSEKGKQFVSEKLDLKIKDDMTGQIVVFETSNVLSSEKYDVYKISFKDSDLEKSRGEYDMLIYDKTNDSYYAFEIKHTAEPSSEQCKNLLNKDFKEIIDRKYGKKENVCVLYNGKPFSSPQGVLYLNISDFLKEITHIRDVKETMENLQHAVIPY